MKSVNVSGLKNNPSEALRQAREDVVLVMNRNEPESILVGIKNTKTLDMAGVKVALATSLFKGGELSLARSAKLAGFSLVDFIAHVSRLGIPVINLSKADTEQDFDTLDQWLAS